MRERAYFIRKLPLHVYTCRFLLPLRWLSVPPGTLPCFLFQKLQPLRKSPSIGRSGWRIAFGNSFSPDYGSFSFWLFGMCLWKFIFSGAFMPVGNDVTIRKSLLCAVMALLLHLSEAAVLYRWQWIFTKVEWRVHLSDGQKIQTYPDEKEYVSGCVSLLI